MPPNNRLAPPVQNALTGYVPMPADSGLVPPVYSRFGSADYAQNLSIGIGEGLTSRLKSAKQTLQDPVQAVKEAAMAIRQMYDDPMLVLQALRQLRQQVMSGPLGAGQAIGEMAPLGVRGQPAPVRSDIVGYHRTTTPFEGEFSKEKNRLGVSFAGPQGYYFSPEVDDPTAQIFGRHVIKADVKIKNPAPVSQIHTGRRIEGVVNQKIPRSILPVSEKTLLEQIEKDPRFLSKGGLVAANSVDDVVAGKTMHHADTWREQEKNLLDAAKQGKLFRLVNPEIIDDFDVKLLKQHGFDGFIYQRPESATSSMPSQIVAIDPKQIERLAEFQD